MVEVDVNWLNIAGSVVLPILTGLVTKRLASSGLKALVLVILSVISGLIQQLVLADGRFETEDFLTSAFVQFLMAVGIHYGLTKPLGVTGTNGVVQQSVPGGVGGQVSASDPSSTGV
jgi:uncharacterized membrane protein